MLEAECQVKPPANTSFLFQVGWLHAEVHLKTDGGPDAEPGASWSEEKRDGFKARMAYEERNRPRPIRLMGR